MDMNPVTSQTSGDERLLLLAMALDTRSGLTFNELVERGLLGDPGQVESESLRRTFQRYREHLEELGVRVTEADHGAGVRYKVDARYTYAEPRAIDFTRDEALVLVTLLSLYLEGANTPYTQDVYRARNKIAAIAGLAPTPASEGGSQETGVAKAYAALAKAYAAGLAARFDYTNAHGVRETKTVQVYGLFERAGHTYAVALDRGADEVKVFRCDRIDPRSVKVEPRLPYQVPADFCVDDYMRLPFQYGTGEPFEATFAVRAGADPATCRALTQGKGSWHEPTADTPRATWHIDASDLAALARWAARALSAGLVPVAPSELVEAVAEGLRKAGAAHA